MRKLIPVILLLVGAYFGQEWGLLFQQEPPPAAAFTQADADTQVRGEGVVINVLADDNYGSRHQRFILRLASGQTVLVAHNIDLAPRVDGLQEGDRVAFYGEFEWNDKGGVIHWTHKDKRGSHADGWLERAGQRYD